MIRACLKPLLRALAPLRELLKTSREGARKKEPEAMRRGSSQTCSKKLRRNEAAILSERIYGRRNIFGCGGGVLRLKGLLLSPPERGLPLTSRRVVARRVGADDDGFLGRLQLGLEAAPQDAARERGGERVVEEEGRRQRPQKEVRPHARAKLRVMVFEHERHGAQAEEGLPDAEQEDDRDERERPLGVESERGARRDEREAAEEDGDEEEVRGEDEAPEVRRVDARDLELPRG